MVSVLLAESLPIEVVEATRPIVTEPLVGVVVVNEVDEVIAEESNPPPVAVIVAVSAAEFCAVK